MENKKRIKFYELISKAKLILQGIWTNIIFVFLNKNKKSVIEQRREICKNCPYVSDNLIKKKLYITKRTDSHCTLCGCNIFLKTASLNSNCGIETYNKNQQNQFLKLKWSKYENTK